MNAPEIDFFPEDWQEPTRLTLTSRRWGRNRVPRNIYVGGVWLVMAGERSTARGDRWRLPPEGE